MGWPQYTGTRVNSVDGHVTPHRLNRPTGPKRTDRVNLNLVIIQNFRKKKEKKTCTPISNGHKNGAIHIPKYSTRKTVLWVTCARIEMKINNCIASCQLRQLINNEQQTPPPSFFRVSDILGPAGGRGQCYFRKYPTSLVFKDSNDLKRIQFPVTNSSPSLSYSFVLDLVGGRGHCYLEYSNGTSRPHEVHTPDSAQTLTVHRCFSKKYLKR